MNKYVIPICDIQAGINKDEFIIAKSLADCEDKVMRLLSDRYDCLEECFDYHEFVKMADENDILIGKITDLETT